MAARRSIALFTGLLVAGIAGSARAGDGSKPASMTVTGEILVTGMDAAQVVLAAGEPIGVVEATVLVARVKHELVAPPGWTLGRLATLPGKQLVVAARKDSNLANVLYGSDGKLLAKTDVGSVGQFVALDAIAGKWLGYGPGEAGKWVRRWGTYDVGGVPPAVNAKPLPAPAPR